MWSLGRRNIVFFNKTICFDLFVILAKLRVVLMMLCFCLWKMNIEGCFCHRNSIAIEYANNSRGKHCVPCVMETKSVITLGQETKTNIC